MSATVTALHTTIEICFIQGPDHWAARQSVGKEFAGIGPGRAQPATAMYRKQSSQMTRQAKLLCNLLHPLQIGMLELCLALYGDLRDAVCTSMLDGEALAYSVLCRQATTKGSRHSSCMARQ